MSCYCGPEAEFFVFDDACYQQTRHAAMYSPDSVEGAWNTGKDEGPDLGHKPRCKGGYYPVSPVDTLQDIRTCLTG